LAIRVTWLYKGYEHPEKWVFLDLVETGTLVQMQFVLGGGVDKIDLICFLRKIWRRRKSKYHGASPLMGLKLAGAN
jgi:hypothetical protein